MAGSKKVATLLVAGAVALAAGQSCNIANNSKVDCGHVGTNQQQCLASGCCWTPEGDGSTIPWCFYNYPAKPCVYNFSWPSQEPPFTPADMDTMLQYFLANINIGGLGGVVASPDTTTPGGSYYFDWMRDESLSMRALMLFVGDTQQVLNYMDSYVQWVLRNQNMQDPNNIDIRTEPKFFLPNGGAYTGGWCRPQTDGPALRATTLTVFANWMIAQGQSSYVKKYLYGPNAPNGGAILYDMQWVAANWQTNGCDLWEEVQSADFFWNRFNFRRAFLDVGRLATQLGDTQNAQLFFAQAQQVNDTLQGHWTGSFVMESENRQMDASVINAFNNGYTDDGVFAPHSTEVAMTIATLNQLFCKTFPINQQDTANGVPGILYGRYAGDQYAGGNPWILTTAGLSQLFFRAAIAVANNTLDYIVDYEAWGQALGVDPSVWFNDLDLARSMAAAGDSVLARIAFHTASYGFHMSEQLDKNTGAEASATDLTWSYATVLKAMVSRGEALALLQHWD